MPSRSNSAGLADGNWPDLRDEVELRHLKLLEHEFGPYTLNESTWKRCSPMYAVKVAEYCAIQASGVALSSCHER